MKKPYIVRLILLMSFLTAANSRSFAQGDDPCTATALTVGITCASINVSNTGATNSAVPAAVCDGGASDADVWFTAIVGANGTLVVRVSPGTLTDMGMAIYTGSSCSALTLNSCVAGGNASFPNMPQKSLTGLSPGSEVWIRVWDVDNDETGTFNICAYVICSAAVTITGATSGCSANLTQLCAGAGFASYSWNGGSTLSCINVSTTSTYTVTVTDADGCTASDSHTFTAIASPSVTITGPSTSCSADVPQLCAASGFSSYSWSNGGTLNCINPSTTGTYTVTISAANGCTASDTHPITVNSSPSISVTGPPSKCSGAGDQLCVGAGYASYTWSNSGTTNCITPSTTGTYSVTVMDANGCTSSASHAITVHASPVILVSGPANSCPGLNAQLCVAGGYSSYSWSNGGTTNCIVPSVSGNYTATVTDAFGCTGTDAQSITIFPAASVSIFGPSSACDGTSPSLCAPLGFSDYAWSTGDTIDCTTPTSTGTYTVIVTDGNGCTASDNMLFTLNALPNSSIVGPASSCNGAAAQLCAPAGSSFYLWSNSNSNSCITTSTSGTYSVTVTGANGCTSSSSHSLTVFPIFAMSVSGPSTACSGSNPTLCATSGSYTYQWSNGATTACINPIVSGNYSVVATSINGCTRSASKGLTVYSPLNANVTGPLSACLGATIPLCGSSGSSSFTWSTGDTTECIDVNSNGVYTVIISDIHGCTASASQAVTFDSTFDVSITGPISGCDASNAILCVPSGYTDYLWSTGDTTECINVISDGSYSVTVHDPVGCAAVNSYQITFHTPPTVSITGPTIVCNGTLANWCADAGFSSYLWSNGGTLACINASIDTTYSVQVTDSFGCTATTSASLQVVNITPAIFESVGILICDTVNPNYTYEWLINGQPTGCTGDSCLPTFSAIYSVIVTDSFSGCSEIATYNYVNVGLPTYTNDFSINIYPNPFFGNEFTVDLNNFSPEKTTIEIYNAVGNRVYKDEFEVTSDRFSKTISIPDRAAGIYYLSVRTKNGVVVRRIVGA